MAVLLVLELYFSPFISLDFSGYQWRIQGSGPPPPLFLNQTGAQRAEKNFFGDHPPPPHLPLVSRSGYCQTQKYCNNPVKERLNSCC